MGGWVTVAGGGGVSTCIVTQDVAACVVLGRFSR